MEYVLLLYGAAFVAAGSALGVQARAAGPGEPLPRAALWALTAFALVHGASDWAALAQFLEAREHGVLSAPLAATRLVLLATSFALLGAFGGVLAARRARPRRPLAAALIPPALFLAVWAAWAALALARRGGAIDPDAAATAEAATRYLLGLPACAAALLGLERARRHVSAESWRTSRYVGAAAIAFAAYGFFAGLVVPSSDLGPARVLNLASFAAATHVPVELFRAASIAAAALLVSEVFVRTTTEHLRSEVEHLRDGFISLVAHDLRTPLGTVDTGAAMLERLAHAGDQDDAERRRRILRAMRASVRAMTKLVNDLLDASRLEARRLAVTPERIDLGPLLLRLVEWAPADAMRGHALRLVPPGPLPPVVADPVRVEQVLSNLLSNAGKYSTPGSEIVLEARAGPRDVTLAVTNEGPGIPPADLPRVFARSYRTRAARAGGVPGLGLGLYIAKGLVETQGGRIAVASEVGGVTTFSFTLPRAAAEQPAAPARPDPEEPRGA